MQMDLSYTRIISQLAGADERIIYKNEMTSVPNIEMN